MNQLPPPTSPPSPAPGDEPTEPSERSAPTGSRRRLVLAAVAATALGVSGVAIGSQLVAADDDVPADEPTTTDEERPDEIDEVDEPTDEERPDEIDEPTENPEDDGEAPDDGEPDDDLSDFDKLFDFEELKTAFEEFDACLSERLPDFEDSGWIEGEEFPDVGEFDLGEFDLGEFDLGEFDGDWDAAFEDLVGGSVTVFSPGGEKDLTFLDFGDGDGTITITQTDGEIEISTDGDVETVDADMPFDLNELDMSDLDLSKLPGVDIEPDPEFAAAIEECTTLLPDGGIFEMVGDSIDGFDHDGD